MSTAHRVLLVDDDQDVRDALRQSLELADYRVTEAGSYLEAVDVLAAGFDGVVVTDVRMPGKTGLDLLTQILRIDPDLPVVVMTGFGDIPTAVDAIRDGAVGFLEKPVAAKRLIEQVDRAAERRAHALRHRHRMAEATLAEVIARGAGGLSLARQMDIVEKYLIEAALRTHGGRVALVADALQLPRKTLYDKLKRHGINPAAYRREA